MKSEQRDGDEEEDFWKGPTVIYYLGLPYRLK